MSSPVIDPNPTFFFGTGDGSNGTPIDQLKNAAADVKAARHFLQYKLFRTGLLCSNIVEAGAFIDTTGSGRSDIQIHFIPQLLGDPPRAQRCYGGAPSASHFNWKTTVPSETVGRAVPRLLAFLAIQSRATRMLSSVPALSW